MKDKDKFVMQLKWSTPADAIEELLNKIIMHDNIHHETHDDVSGNEHYDEFIVNYVLEVPSLLHSIPDDEKSWQFFEELVYECTGVYPQYADYESNTEVIVHFSVPADYKLGWGFRGWVAGLEEMLQVADMREEIQQYIIESLQETQNEHEQSETDDT